MSFFLRMIDDKEVAILFTLALSSSGFILASALDVSQAITMVIAGLVIGHDMKTKNFAKKTIVSLDSFWELVDEVLNSFLFVKFLLFFLLKTRSYGKMTQVLFSCISVILRNLSEG